MTPKVTASTTLDIGMRVVEDTRHAAAASMRDIQGREPRCSPATRTSSTSNFSVFWVIKPKEGAGPVFLRHPGPQGAP